MPKRTQPKRTHFWSKRTHFFGQNVPSLPKRTHPFGQNVPNLFFPMFNIYLYFWGYENYLHIGQNVPSIYFNVIFEKVLWYFVRTYKINAPKAMIKYTWATQTVHNTPVMNILKGYYYIILF